MPRYRFTGESPETFPTIVTANGALVCTKVGETVDLPDEVEHAHLERVGERGKAKHVGEFAVDQGVTVPEPEPEPDDPAGITADDPDDPDEPDELTDPADPANTQEV